MIKKISFSILIILILVFIGIFYLSIYGLNKRVGNISYYDSQGREMFTKPYSEDTAKIIDEEVNEEINNG